MPSPHIGFHNGVNLYVGRLMGRIPSVEVQHRHNINAYPSLSEAIHVHMSHNGADRSLIPMFHMMRLVKSGSPHHLEGA